MHGWKAWLFMRWRALQPSKLEALQCGTFFEFHHVTDLWMEGGLGAASFHLGLYSSFRPTRGAKATMRQPSKECMYRIAVVFVSAPSRFLPLHPQTAKHNRFHNVRVTAAATVVSQSTHLRRWQYEHDSWPISMFSFRVL